jgi:hypothetical protein
MSARFLSLIAVSVFAASFGGTVSAEVLKATNVSGASSSPSSSSPSIDFTPRSILNRGGRLVAACRREGGSCRRNSDCCRGFRCEEHEPRSFSCWPR